ncbi:MAG: ATP-binding protein [Sandaracinaceae bacterium]
MNRWDAPTLALLPILGMMTYCSVQELVLWRLGRGARVHGWTVAWSLIAVLFVGARFVQRTTIDLEVFDGAVRVQYAAGLLLALVAVPAVHSIRERWPPFSVGLTSVALTLLFAGLLFFTPLFLTDDLILRDDLFGGAHLTLEPGPLLGLIGLYFVGVTALCLRVLQPMVTLSPARNTAFRVVVAVAVVLGANDMLAQLGLLPSYPCFELTFVVLALALSYVHREATYRLREDLQHAVEHRTAQLRRALAEAQETRRQLVLADRLASVGTLAAGAAHEINNPLAYATTNLQLLEEELAEADADLAQRTSPYVEEAREGCHRIRRIVEDLSTFARMREAQEDRRPVELPTLIDRCVAMTRNEIRHRAKLVRDYGETPPVDGDASRLGQVFVNLLVNAAQALPVGHATEAQIHVRTRRRDDGLVAVEVTDTGPGIPEDIQDRIFDPFFTTKPQGVGSGLGLAVCHGIVAAHDGRIEVQSRPGVGTTMRVLLPATEPEEAAVVSSRPVRLELPVERAARVLVVDDEPALTRALVRALRGHEVDVAEDGARALERCQEDTYDVILCDVMMPEVSGPQFYDRLGTLDPDQAERVIFITGGAFSASAQEFLARMGDRVLVKPVEIEQLRTAVVSMAARPMGAGRRVPPAPRPSDPGSVPFV